MTCFWRSLFLRDVQSVIWLVAGDLHGQLAAALTLFNRSLALASAPCHQLRFQSQARRALQGRGGEEGLHEAEPRVKGKIIANVWEGSSLLF